jgi:benzylsuccinate CoA-transferase BbsF subunit
MGRRTFEGLKVLDFTQAAVGPITTQYLAHLGATVVKVDSSVHPDDSRNLPPFTEFVVDRDCSGLFSIWNSSKMTIAIDLRQPEGVDIAKRLAIWADVVVENFSGHTIDRWGLDYDSLAKENPGIIMLRTDYTCPRLNLAALAGALLHKKRTGKGQYLDASQYEMSLTFLSPLILEYVVNGGTVERHGNRSDDASPHGVFQCRGNDRWCAIAVTTDAEWRALSTAVGEAALRNPHRYATLQLRKSNEDELERLLEEWTRCREATEVVAILQAVGVPCGIVEDARDIDCDPQLLHYEFMRMVDHPKMGQKGCPVRRNTFRMSAAEDVLSRPPILGEHTREVCTEILGMTDEEIDGLANRGILR